MPDAPHDLDRSIALISEVVEKDWSDFQLFAKWAEHALSLTRTALNDGDDILVSAVGSLLRRQDPTAKLRANQKRDPLVTDKNQVGPLIRKHMFRKLNKYRKQAQNQGNQGIREADLSDEESLNDWKAAFVDRRGSQAREDPEQIESYIAEALSTLRELIPDEELLAIAKLRLMGHTLQEIAQTLSVPYSRVRSKIDEIRRILELDE